MIVVCERLSSPLLRHLDSVRDLEMESVVASDDRYRAIVETAREGIVTLDATGRITSANPAAAAMLCVEMEQILGRRLSDFAAENNRDRVALHLGRRGDEGASRQELRFRRADGRDLWALVTMSSLFDAAGRAEGWLAMVTDISELKRAEEQRTQLLDEPLRSQLAMGAQRDRLRRRRTTPAGCFI